MRMSSMWRGLLRIGLGRGGGESECGADGAGDCAADGEGVWGVLAEFGEE